MPGTSDDRLLLTAYAESRGNEVFTEIVRHYVESVRAIGLRLAGGESAVADKIVYEVLTKLARDPAAALRYTALGYWLYTNIIKASIPVHRSALCRELQRQGWSAGRILDRLARDGTPGLPLRIRLFRERIRRRLGLSGPLAASRPLLAMPPPCGDSALVRSTASVVLAMASMNRPRMAAEEIEFFLEQLNGVRRYFEFGVGGSTITAWKQAQSAGGELSIYGVDSDAATVARVVAASEASSSIRLESVDIGTLDQWGYPADRTPTDNWKLYSQAISRFPNPGSFDLVLIDGRFRIACALQTVLACGESTRVLIHDYLNRPEYRAVERWLEPLHIAGTLVLFRKRPHLTPASVHDAYLTYWTDLR